MPKVENIGYKCFLNKRQSGELKVNEIQVFFSKWYDFKIIENDLLSSGKHDQGRSPKEVIAGRKWRYQD